MTRLDQWPELYSWFFSQNSSGVLGRGIGERFALNICYALSCDSEADCENLLSSFELFNNSPEVKTCTFLAVISIFQTKDCDLLSTLGTMALGSVYHSKAHNLCSEISKAADSTGIISLRFLAAWLALNLGSLNICIDECEKVNQPYSYIYTLQGQALLELGHALEAANILIAATSLAPKEILAWFQLAKAQHVLDNPIAAWEALEKCREISPRNPEVALFMAIISLDQKFSRSHRQLAYDELFSLLDQISDQSDVILRLLQLAVALDDKQAAARLTNRISGNKIRQSKIQLLIVAEVLRKFQKIGWMDISARLLNALLEPRQ